MEVLFSGLSSFWRQELRPPSPPPTHLMLRHLPIPAPSLASLLLRWMRHSIGPLRAAILFPLCRLAVPTLPPALPQTAYRRPGHQQAARRFRPQRLSSTVSTAFFATGSSCSVAILPPAQQALI